MLNFQESNLLDVSTGTLKFWSRDFLEYFKYITGHLADSFWSVNGWLMVGYRSLNAHGHVTDSQRPVYERPVTGWLTVGYQSLNAHIHITVS